MTDGAGSASDGSTHPRIFPVQTYSDSGPSDSGLTKECNSFVKHASGGDTRGPWHWTPCDFSCHLRTISSVEDVLEGILCSHAGGISFLCWNCRRRPGGVVSNIEYTMNEFWFFLELSSHFAITSAVSCCSSGSMFWSDPSLSSLQVSRQQMNCEREQLRVGTPACKMHPSSYFCVISKNFLDSPKTQVLNNRLHLKGW